LSAIVLIVFASFCATSAAAQTWWVQSADYGSGNRRQDVTQTVRRLVSGPNFRVNNATLGGDPYVGADKTLRIVGRDTQGNVRDFKYSEGSTVNSAMFRGMEWHGGGGNGGGNNANSWFVQSADYGAGNRRQDVTQTVRRLVNGPNFRVNNTTMGTDPWVGADKTLRIQGRDSQGNVREFKYGEGSTVNTSMFRGQGSGGWNGGNGGNNNWDNRSSLSITSAQWGSGNRYQNVSQRLQNMIRNNRLSVKVTPQNMGGDPTPGVSKKLNVTYRWQGRSMNVTRVEGEMLNLP
jgi:predicted aconitase with swiveling domain